MPASGEVSSLAIHAGTTKGGSVSVGLVDGVGSAEGLPSPGTVSFPDAATVSFPEVRGPGLEARVAEVNGLLPGDGLCLETDGPPTLPLGPRLGELSDEAGPQPATAVRSIRLRSIPRHDRDGPMSLDL